ncbi:hypothetical protein WN51_08427 [Melipona quadrifasciata]|uniref:Uncharacterized protein n=1 Tax=Melipona quadrifasciata TaxID=166423 RepID=A0A0M9AA03_9HYME|nr:hypothetical protein WN51_08427 [Melipona quadrifasciata]
MLRQPRRNLLFRVQTMRNDEIKKFDENPTHGERHCPDKNHQTHLARFDLGRLSARVDRRVARIDGDEQDHRPPVYACKKRVKIGAMALTERA